MTARGPVTSREKTASGEAGDAPGARDRFWEKLGEMGRMWRTQINRRLKPLGVSHIQWVTLRYLQVEGDGVVQKDLAAAVGVEGPAMVGVLDRLVARGHVERRQAVHDRRAKTVHLTTGGRAILERAEAELGDLRERMLEGFAAAELETCVRVFERMTERA